MITPTHAAGTPAKSGDPGFLVVMVVILTGLVIWSGLLLFSVPGALDAVARQVSGSTGAQGDAAVSLRSPANIVADVTPQVKPVGAP